VVRVWVGVQNSYLKVGGSGSGWGWGIFLLNFSSYSGINFAHLSLLSAKF